MDKDFFVCRNTSKEGLGGLFMQYGQVIPYISRKLRRHEDNYATHNLELLTIVYSSRVWRNYLIGWNLELKIDHCGLQHILNHSDLNVRQMHWLELLNKYDFDITYIKKTVNIFVDVLVSRPFIFSVIPLKTNLRENMID
jgi:hypothetical protein